MVRQRARLWSDRGLDYGQTEVNFGADSEIRTLWPHRKVDCGTEEKIVMCYFVVRCERGVRNLMCKCC